MSVGLEFFMIYCKKIHEKLAKSRSIKMILLGLIVYAFN